MKSDREYYALLKILDDEYGIKNRDDLNAKIAELKPLNIGIFNNERMVQYVEKNSKKAV